MEESIDKLSLMTLSKKREEVILGLEGLLKVSDKISDAIIQAVKSNDDKFIISERISLYFSNFLNKLKILLSGNDRDLSFWAATLLVHYGINDAHAEKVLLDAVLLSDLEKAFTATTILYRTKNSQLKTIISKRLEDPNLAAEYIPFFKEKLDKL